MNLSEMLKKLLKNNKIKEITVSFIPNIPNPIIKDSIFEFNLHCPSETGIRLMIKSNTEATLTIEDRNSIQSYENLILNFINHNI